MADHASRRGMPWDALWLATFRMMVRVARLNPYVRAQMASGRERDTFLTRLAAEQPQLAGAVAAILWGGTMMILFDLMTMFRDVRAVAIVWALGGAFFGIAMGWYWSYTKRMGGPPKVV